MNIWPLAHPMSCCLLVFQLDDPRGIVEQAPLVKRRHESTIEPPLIAAFALEKSNVGHDRPRYCDFFSRSFLRGSRELGLAGGGLAFPGTPGAARPGTFAAGAP